VLPWLGGLCLISYLGSYPDPAKGNTGTITFGWGFVVILALTAIVYALAMWVRLDRERVTAHIEDAEAEAADSEEKIGSAP
jgi:hypothetical protein